METRDDLIARLKDKGLTLKKISAESGFSEKNIDSVLSGIMSSTAVRNLLDEVTAAENFFEQLFGMQITDIRAAWKNKNRAGSMKDFAKKHGTKIEE
jgi:DNA-binding NarL/FixJ family response regulator